MCRNPAKQELPAARYPCWDKGEGRKKKLCRICELWVVGRIFGMHLRVRHFQGEDIRKISCKFCPYAAERLADLKRHSDVKHPKLLHLVKLEEEEYIPEPGEGVIYTPTPILAEASKQTDVGYIPYTQLRYCPVMRSKKWTPFPMIWYFKSFNTRRRGKI